MRSNPASRQLIEDLHRPQYHFLPPANWLNDPNGLIQWQGTYHLFYQYNPQGAYFGTQQWGHAISQDLVHWKHLPVALSPTPGTVDADGCWSGVIVDSAGTPTLIYTGIQHVGNSERIERPCLAVSHDDLVTWQKHDDNPIIVPPSDLDLTGFRDHCIWQTDRTWYQIIGSGIEGVGGTALLYRSIDLIDWEYLCPIYTGSVAETGHMWECPDLFRLKGRDILVASTLPSEEVVYFIGQYRNHRFVPETHRVMDDSRYFYAPMTMLDNQGRRLMWGWLREGRSREAQMKAGWSGVISLPRVVSFHEDQASLRFTPVPELQTLRGQHKSYADLVVTPESREVALGVRGNSLEIIAEIDPRDAHSVGFKLSCSPNGEEQTLVYYDQAQVSVVVDRERSSLSRETHCDVRTTSLRLMHGECLKVHIFLDHSVLEVFVNDTTYMSSRIYPTRNDSTRLGIFAIGGSAIFRRIDVWEMGSIW